MGRRDTISEVEAEEVRDASEGVLDDLYSSLWEVVIVDEGIVKVGALDDLFGGCVVVEKLIEENLTLVETGAVNHYQRAILSEYLVNIEAV